MQVIRLAESGLRRRCFHFPLTSKRLEFETSGIGQTVQIQYAPSTPHTELFKVPLKY